MKETVIVTAIGSFSAQNVISACHAAGMRVVGCDIYPAEWVVNSQDVEVFYKAPYATDREQYRNFIKELCRKEQASVLMPLTDVEIDVIQQWRTELAEDFKALGAEVWISDVSAISLCRNKEKMEAFLRERKLCRTIPGVRLAELKEKLGLTYVFITHDLTSVTYLCDEVMFLYKGRITEHIPVSRIAQTTDVYARKLLDSIIEFDEEYDDEMDVKESEESA